MDLGTNGGYYFVLGLLSLDSVSFLFHNILVSSHRGWAVVFCCGCGYGRCSATAIQFNSHFNALCLQFDHSFGCQFNFR